MLVGKWRHNYSVGTPGPNESTSARECRTFTAFRPHFSRPDCPRLHLQRLHAAPVPFTLLFTLLLLFLSRFVLFAESKRAVIYFLPPASRRPCAVSGPRFIFIFLLLIMECFFLLFHFIITCSRVHVTLFVLRGERASFFLYRGPHRIMVIKG